MASSKKSPRKIMRSAPAGVKVARTTVPRPRGRVAPAPPPDPITPKPRQRAGEVFKTDGAVIVTGPPRAQLPKRGEF